MSMNMNYSKLIIGLILAMLVVLGFVYLYAISKEDSIETEQPATELNTVSPQPASLSLEARSGTAPEVTSGIPHIQLDQTSNDDTYDKLITQTYEIDGVVGGESQSSLPGAQSIAVPTGIPFNQNAMINGREFAHIHANPGRGSLHLVLSTANAAVVVDQGWGVYHPFHDDGRIPGMVMVFAPRDDQDLSSIVDIIEASYEYATQL